MRKSYTHPGVNGASVGRESREFNPVGDELGGILSPRPQGKDPQVFVRSEVQAAADDGVLGDY